LPVATVASLVRRELPVAVASALGLGLTAGALPQPAAADMVTAENLVLQSTLVINQQSNVYSFSTPGAGTLYVSIEDVLWPVPLASFNMSVNSPTSVLGTMNVGGEMALTVSQAGGYSVNVNGTAGGSLDIGLYSLQVNFLPQGAVPLPGSLALMLGGLFALGGARWWWMRNESVMYTT
jgi:hypothetical protein